jgi:hypothetical protein
MLSGKIVFYVGLLTKEGKHLNQQVVVRHTSAIFAMKGWHGFTVTDHTGCWKGVPERALSFTVFIDGKVDKGVVPAAIAKQLAKLFNQDAVLWSVEAAHAGIEYAED